MGRKGRKQETLWKKKVIAYKVKWTGKKEKA